MRRVASWRIALAGFVAGTLTSQAIADSAPVLRARAERLAAATRCDEALAALGEAAEQEPLDARAHVVAGQCQMRLDLPAAAAASFEQARTLDTALPQLDLQLGIARFHADDLAGSERALADARAAGTAGPEIDFYEALLALARGGAPDGTAAALERAGLARPGSLDPAASYYAGRAWQAADDADRAREALERVRATHPDTPWADAAERALAQWGTRGAARSAPWASLRAGLEWDSNVAFLGQGLARPDEIGRDSDGLGVWSAEAGTPLAKIGDATLGVRGFYTGSAHFHDHDFDLEYPSAALWLDLPTSERSSLLLEGGFGYAWLGYEPYVATAWLAPEWRVESRYGETRVRAGVAGYDFHINDGDETDALPNGSCPAGVSTCGPPGVDERDERNRDGIGVAASIEHRLPLRGGKTELRGGPLLERYWAKGREWDAWGFGATFGVRQQLPLDLTLDVAAAYIHRPFDHPSTYPDPNDVVRGREAPLSNSDRNDHFVEVDVRLERAITPNLTASLRYDYLRNASNVAVFDYDRHLVGAYLTYTWQGPAR